MVTSRPVHRLTKILVYGRESGAGIVVGAAGDAYITIRQSDSGNREGKKYSVAIACRLGLFLIVHRLVTNN